MKAKIRSYYAAFEEDFAGSNGRKAKTLWLTEVAMGSSDKQVHPHHPTPPAEDTCALPPQPRISPAPESQRPWLRVPLAAVSVPRAGPDPAAVYFNERTLTLR